MITTQRKLEIIKWNLRPYDNLNNEEEYYIDTLIKEYGGIRGTTLWLMGMEDLEKELMIQLRDEKINEILK